MIARPSSTGGLKTWPRSVDQQRALRRRRRGCRRNQLPRALAGVGRGEARSRARRGRRARPDPRSRSRCDGYSGCVTTMSRTPGLDRGVDEREDLVAAHVPGGQHEVVAGDRPRARRAASGSTAPSSSTTGTGSAVTPSLAQLELEAHPDRDLAAGVGGEDLVLLVRRAPRSASTRPGALARGDLDRDRVEPADGAVERDRADRVDPGHGLADDPRALRGRRVVRLQAEPREPELREAAREDDVRRCGARRRRARCGRACRSRRARARGRGRSGSGGRPARPRRRSLAPDLGRRLERRARAWRTARRS